MTLPRELGDREYQSYGEDGDGNITRRVGGSVFLVDSDGNKVELLTRDGIPGLSVIDHDSKNALVEIRDLLIKMSEKIDKFFM
jgi:hypothetical protein